MSCLWRRSYSLRQTDGVNSQIFGRSNVRQGSQWTDENKAETEQKKKRNGKETKMKQMSTHTHTHTHTPQNANFFFHVSVFCPVLCPWTVAVKWTLHVALQGKWRWRWGHRHGSGWLHNHPIRNIEIKKQEAFSWGVRPALSKGKILTYSSLPYSGFDLLNQCPPQTAKDQRHCAETNLHVVKLATKQKTFDLYIQVTWITRVAEVFHECCRIDGDLSKNTLSFCFVSVPWV